MKISTLLYNSMNEDSSLIQKLYSYITLTAVAAVRSGKFAYKILRLWLLWVHSRKRGKETGRKVHYYVDKAVWITSINQYYEKSLFS
jgi:hypothetical protein